MHEMAIAQSVLDIALTNASQFDAKKITSIHLLVGQMTGVEAEALRFCFAALSEGTIAAEAELVIETVPLIVYCRDCGKEFTVQRYRFICNNCSSSNIEILSGRELKVEHLEVD